MWRFYLVTMLLIALSFVSNAQRKRAFMVGISKYHTNGYKVWDNIHGAEDVQLLTPELEKKGFKVQSLVNEKATYQGIVNALTQFIAISRKGDIVYIHFSCHGQPVEDGLKGDTLDEKDHWDEALIPIDAGKVYNYKGYRGEKHLTDDELNVYFTRLRKKIGPTGMLYVAMDACHAGEISREDETIRGINEGLTKNISNKYNPHHDTTKHYTIPKSKDMAPAMFLEACKSYERNAEVVVKGKEYGSLSYNIWQAINRISALDSKTKEEFKVKLYASIKERGRWPGNQTLVIEE